MSINMGGIAINEDGTITGRIIDFVPVKHGRWIEEIGMLMCSECGDSWGTEMEEMVRDFNYCPYCGAEMKGDK